MILFGNCCFDNQTWAWDGVNWTELHPATSPSPRYSVELAYDPTRGRLVLFGGYGDAGRSDDTWSWDGQTWVEEDLRRSPPARNSYAMAQFGRYVVLFGGLDADQDLRDTWILRKKTWTRLDPHNESPAARSTSSAVWDPIRRSVMLFGGIKDPSTALADTWTLAR